MRGVPGRVLIVRLGAIGDVVNALIVAAALRDARADVDVGWAAHEQVLPLVERHPCIDRVHVWKRGSGAAGFRAFLAGVRRARYDVALDLQRIAKSALVARLSGAPRVVGFDRRRSKEGSWVLAKERIDAGDPRAHMVEQYLGFLRHLGLSAVRPRHVLPEDGPARAWAEAEIAALGASPVVVGVGASKAPNRWIEPRFGELAARLARELALPVVLTGGADERTSAAHSIAAAIESTGGAERAGGAARVRDLVGRTSLLQLLELLRRARLFIGCDTGPMHLAAAAGTRVLALFGPADPRRTGPWDPDGRHRVLQAPSQRMADVSVEAAAAAARALLG
jgi:heptosyltransferase-1